MGIRFEFLKAGNGDCILISTSNGTNILIDGGLTDTYREIKKHLREKSKLDLVVLTHVDNDHICGLIGLLRKDEKNRNKINELWFNSFKSILVEKESNGNIGASQGILFETLIEKYKHIKHKGNIYLREEMKQNNYSIGNDINLILLSPNKEDLNKFKIDWQSDKEKMKSKFCNGRGSQNISAIKKDSGDKSLTNRTSIAFILEYQEEKYLFLGDAHRDVINKSLMNLGYSKENKLKIKFVKLSHHGSYGNIDNIFLDLIDCQQFVILTNGKKFDHPNKETLSLIYKHKQKEKAIEFIFNYSDYYKNKISSEDMKTYNIKTNFRRML